MRGPTFKSVAYGATLIVLCTAGAYLLRAGQQGKASSSAPEGQDWAAYGGGPLNDHYSPVAQLNREDVTQLQVAWTFHRRETGGLQSSPPIVDGVVRGITATPK